MTTTPAEVMTYPGLHPLIFVSAKTFFVTCSIPSPLSRVVDQFFHLVEKNLRCARPDHVVRASLRKTAAKFSSRLAETVSVDNWHDNARLRQQLVEAHIVHQGVK